MMSKTSMRINLIMALMMWQSASFVVRRPAQHHLTCLGSSECCMGYSIRDSFNLIVLGDLHMEDDMSKHEEARSDCIHALKDLSLLPCPPTNGAAPCCEKTATQLIKDFKDLPAGDLSVEQLEMMLTRKREGELMRASLVSLGDLGRQDAGTTKSFQDAKAFLDGFTLPYEIVTGNHDLEGLDEFDSDKENLQAWMNCFHKDTPQFCRQIGEKTLLVGVSTTRFRDAPYSSHEVYVDDAQLEWLQDVVQSHSAEDGWKMCVVSHAPPMGSGLRVLQNVHVTNGCAWLNHCSSNRNFFIRMVKENPQIKLWLSGHFHLSHEYEDTISTVGSCTFVQTGVVGAMSTRDGRRQTRLIQGCSDRLKLYTINHHIRDEKTGKADLRLDAEIDLGSGSVRRTRGEEDFDEGMWFRAFLPHEEDGCYIDTPDGTVADATRLDSDVCSWWHMADGAVLGLHEGQLVEYDAETLAPLGIVVNQNTLAGREVLVIEDGTAVVLVDEHNDDVEIVHPNDDGSYWRKVQRNKRIRHEEMAREAVARLWLEKKRDHSHRQQTLHP